MTKDKKILLVGATFGSNFGDFLFAKMFQDFIREKLGIENVFWYKSVCARSDYFPKYLNYDRNYRLKDIDALVYISGGYFMGNDTKPIHYVIRFLSYFWIGIRCIIRRIPYCIIGVEAARSNSRIIDWIQHIILRNAKVVVVRNKLSFDYVIGAVSDKVPVYCTSDSVFSMQKHFYDEYPIEEEISKGNKPMLFLHVNPYHNNNQKIIDCIVPVINQFIKNHPEFSIVLGTDQYGPDMISAMENVRGYIQSNNVILNTYGNPVSLCGVLDECSVIVTTKLHVGIVGAHFGKSVISFSGHTSKIKRLYEQLGLDDRTTPLNTLTIESGVSMLETYYNKPITVDKKIIDSAKDNFKILNDFIDAIK